MTRRRLLRYAAVTSVAPALVACASVKPGTGDSAGSGGLELASSEVDHEAGSPEAIPDVVTGMSGLAGSLLGRLGAEPGNVVVSPYSVAVALAMTVNGARGSTASEMLDVLGIEEVARLDAGLDALTRELESLAGEHERADGTTATVALDAANALFGQRDTEWEQPFLDALARYYGAGMRLVDYTADSEQARTLINSWTAEQTHDKIPEIIPAGVLDALTRLVLVNAIYLKAPWEFPFEKASTVPGAFHLADGSSVQTDMMSQLLEGGGYAESDTWQAVRLPYAGRGLAMTVIAPREGAMEQVWSEVTGAGLPAILGAPEQNAVRLTMPRWTFRTQAPLKDVLESLGMPTAFDPHRADFSAMTTTERLYVSAVLHEAFIAVDEEGIEAAAATAVVIKAESMPLTVEMAVNRPFLFAIHDLRHNTPLFIGRVDDPTA